MTCCTHNCNQGRACPKGNEMKKSHERTPRLTRDAEYIWPIGSDYQGDEWRPGENRKWFNNADVWGFTMILMAVVGIAALVLLAAFGGLK